MKTVSDFKEYQLLGMNKGRKLENWNGYILDRPDPQIIWKEENFSKDIHAIYKRNTSGGGCWERKKMMKDTWNIHYRDLTFHLKLMGFKHTGLFPEQAYNWNLVRKIIKEAKRPIKVLNLFAYTGAMSIASLKEGAEVVHVDASRGMVDWAKENVELNGLQDQKIRFLVDDVLKFVKREIRRNNTYDMIIMDPPSFGRGAKNEVWDIENDLYELVELCTQLLSDQPLLFLINSYSTGLSKTVLENILRLTVLKKYPGVIDSDELGIKMEKNDLILPCGIYARWTNKTYE